MKQLKIDCETENDALPSNYNSLFLSFIKGSVESYDAERYSVWFDKSRNSAELRKSYTFSCYFPGGRFQNGTLVLPERRFTLFFSTYDLADLTFLYNAFYGSLGNRWPAPGNGFTAKSLQAVPLPKIVSNRVLIKFDSPLLARERDVAANRERFLSFDDPNFSPTIRRSVATALVRSGFAAPLDGFSITPVQATKTVVSYYNSMRVTANLGRFELTGDPRLLNYLLASGLGAATGSGRGKFRVVG